MKQNKRHRQLKQQKFLRRATIALAIVLGLGLVTAGVILAGSRNGTPTVASTENSSTQTGAQTIPEPVATKDSKPSPASPTATSAAETSAAAATPTPSAAPTPKPSPTPKPTARPTPSATPTPKPTPTPRPTPTPTPEPKSYAGKLWWAIGDSITQAGLYPDLLVKKMGFQYYYNDGVAGACMATMGDRVTKNKLATFDLVTVFAGTNDYGLGTPLGAPGDSATANTFYGHVQKVINKIRAARPDVELVFLTPIVRGAYEDQPVYPAPNEAGYTLEQYVQAIQDVCAQNQVKVINLFATSGITAQNVEKYTKDNLHPNWDGAELIATAIQQGLIY